MRQTLLPSSVVDHFGETSVFTYSDNGQPHCCANTSPTEPQELAQQRFQSLVQGVHTCERCPRMQGRTRVLSPANGSLSSRLLFVAEAPGRFGADRWQIPLYGDQTGRNFDRLLVAAGLQRNAIFITNAVLCNPRDAQGRNATPSVSEQRNCAPYLTETLEILQPQLVVALGGVALQSLGFVEPHHARLATHVGRLIAWNHRFLMPLYHPGPRACIRRPLIVQAQDYQRLGVLLHTEKILAFE